MNTQPTLNRPGVTVVFPGAGVMAEIEAHKYLVRSGVKPEQCWLTPTTSADGKPQLVFHGGR